VWGLSDFWQHASCRLRPGHHDSITQAGLNALDNAAQRARADANVKNLGLIVYSIGLGNAPGGVDNTLLKRVANDPAANNYNTSYLPGMYLYAPDTSTLNQAFSQIASEYFESRNRSRTSVTGSQ